MNLTILMTLVFFVCAGLFLTVFYFLIAAPSESRALRARLEAIQEASSFHSGDAGTELLHREVLSSIPTIDRILVEIRPLVKLSFFLQQAAVEMTVGTLLALVFSLAALACITCLLLNQPALLVVLITLCAGSLPFVGIAIKRRRRLDNFEQQLPDAIDLLARAVRAGHAFTTALELIASEMSQPIAGEFRRTYEQQNIGLPLREALQNMLVRVPVADMYVFVTALVIQRESGGNLAEILDNLSHVIRERFKLMRQVKVYTAQGRISLYIMTALPPLVALGLYVLNRAYVSRLYTDPIGQKMLMTAAGLQVIGYLVIRKIVQPKV